MKLSLKWLNDYVPNNLSVDELAHKLTMAGQEIEKIEKVNGDTILDLEITPNRPDCLSVLGLAREISAVLNLPKKEPSIPEYKWTNEKADITIQNFSDCSRYIGILIQNVKIQPSPDWLKNKIESIGLRSINNVVDITNFCMMELGQPLHAFDFDRLKGGKIVVRRANEGEKIVTIDGDEKALDSTILVIADESHPVAVAGIMGGKESEVSSNTKNILLEAAFFNPLLIRRASKKIVLNSDSSYRFERGVDFDNVYQTACRAVSLVMELAGGHIISFSDVQSRPINMEKIIQVSLEEINKRIGSDISQKQCEQIFSNLDFSVSLEKDIFKIIPPSFRQDLRIKQDVIEEVARVIGYDQLPVSLPKIVVSNVRTNKLFNLRKKVRQSFLNQGFCEILPFSMVSEKNLKDLNLLGSESVISVKNPLSVEQGFMRPSMLPSFLTVIANNFNKGQKNLRFFEIGKIYQRKQNIKDTVDLETEKIGFALTGINSNDWRENQKRKDNFYDIKGVLEILISDFTLDKEKVSSENFLDFPSANIMVGGKTVGVIGKIAEAVLKSWGIKEKEIYYAEINAEVVFAALESSKKFHPMNDFPSIVRDISLAIAKNVSYQEVKDFILIEKPEYLQSIDFTEEYVGDKVAADLKGLTFSLTYRSSEKTLRDEEIDSVNESVVKALCEKYHASRR